MAPKNILLEETDSVVTITFNRPDALNALTPELLDETAEALRSISTRNDIGVVVLTGAGRSFSAGVDLKALTEKGLDLSEGNVGDDLNRAAREVQTLLEDMPQATIAKVNGFCFTGGVELMLACDIVIAAEEAKFGDTHAKLGLRPTWGMTQRLPKRVGMMRARELSFTARTFSGTEAARMGLVLEAVPLVELNGFVDQLSAGICENSKGSIAAYKDLYKASENNGFSAGLEYEKTTEYSVADVRERMSGFLASLGGKKN
ncbi:MAG: enoyl-CoA hydratase/isomerase family protein [Alphaproteobacteria bacterium]|jgi:enoyl-CoA hydratase|nr:enoyl-CoA hydratase/isomerase family protein [Alphaproteobacteria bacterium]MBT4083282.1 enoyl-CoA hydratase/isomerase family protein [Alphaproteobacteria bacterium]MBT4545054.1 enoyl-CoA hydratase/isomerase family protein [Alphaproteobacteria bacterium]